MFRSFIRNNLLFVAIGFSVAVGVGMGLAGRSFSLSPDTMSLIQFPGEIFMRLLKLMILPLVVSSLISALAQMDVKNCSKMGAITLIYYLTTVFLATILGIFLVLMIHPGDPRLSPDHPTMETEKISAMDTILDLIRNMFPDNLVQASFERTHTVYKKSLTNQINASSQQITKEVAEQRGMNILGIIVFCVGFGIVTSHYAEKVPVMVNFFLALDKIIMKLMLSVMWYILTVLIGLFVHSFITIPALYVMITRKNPLNIFKYMMEGGIAAMGTSSS
ncbi:transporter, dicarboxylate/amino acid:cation Na+/H+ symporter family protein [Ancylostoma duodenale]|uniref:Amino acid transporter n=1 Tax=Ancylostoma duodenale TaxID=51022 RepID=A0A0C2CW68_9BILA|nr:transporter, dicarboxylate/amino acid:cation Na+/H+ symporter family protein [Ancylostoma duodenale]